MKLQDVERAIAETKAEIAKKEAVLVALESLRLQLLSDRTHTVSKMQATESIRPRRARRGRPPRTDHPFTRALDERGSSLAEWARRHRVDIATVKGWTRLVDGRAIPRERAEKIEAEFTDPKTGVSAVPATLATWKNGIR